MVVFVFTLAWVVDCSNMSWVKPSSEAPGHLRVPVTLLPSLLKIIISPDILIRFFGEASLEFEGFPSKILCRWTSLKPLDHCLNGNFIWHRWCLGSEPQKPSDVSL
jgi:hypothetical protein